MAERSIKRPLVTFPSEPPTVPMSREARAAEIVRNWAQCLPAQQRTIERMAKRLAEIAKRKGKP